MLLLYNLLNIFCNMFITQQPSIISKENNKFIGWLSITDVIVPVTEHKHPEVIEAEKKEVQNLQDFNTSEEVEDKVQ